MDTNQPNILFFMTDQMQGRVLGPDHPCITPNFDHLAARGIRFPRAYTPNAICSPARASLMTGLLPHNHGVLEVEHNVDEDQCVLRTDKPHWAQRVERIGYSTGYFGKWHVERSNDLQQFGWHVDGGSKGRLFTDEAERVANDVGKPNYSLIGTNHSPPGYKESLLYAVTDQSPAARRMSLPVNLALRFLDDALAKDAPWCCFVSLIEPHDPFIAGQEAFDRYDVDALELPPNVFDDLAGKPALYKKASQVWADMNERQKKEAAACYFASITEIDEQFGRLMARLESAGALENTLVVVTSDHGEFLGAHGLYCKNISAFEEAYNIPLVMAGPGIVRGEVSEARVGLHDLCPTLLEYAGADPIQTPDSRSFAPMLSDPEVREADYTKGYAEYHGGRIRLTQRVVWQDSWKFIFNGFDFDELYNLQEDPYELRNLAADPDCGHLVKELSAEMWKRIQETGDRALWNAHYPILRLAPYGPRILEEDET